MWYSICFLLNLIFCFFVLFFFTSHLFFFLLFNFQFLFWKWYGMHLKRTRIFEINRPYVVRVNRDRWHVQRLIDNDIIEVSISDGTTGELLPDYKHIMVLVFMIRMGSLAFVKCFCVTCTAQVPGFLSLKFVLYHTLVVVQNLHGKWWSEYDFSWKTKLSFLKFLIIWSTNERHFVDKRLMTQFAQINETFHREPIFLNQMFFLVFSFG